MIPFARRERLDLRAIEQELESCPALEHPDWWPAIEGLIHRAYDGDEQKGGA